MIFKKKKIEQAFGCRIFDMFGITEGALLTMKSPWQDYYVPYFRLNHFEVLKGNKHARPGEPGDLAVTSFLHYSMPLIRYEVNDIATYKIVEEKKVISRIIGRQSDIITLGGRHLGPTSLVNFIDWKETFKKVKESQFIYNNKRIKYRYVPREPVSEKDLRKHLNELFGDDELEIEEVNNIQRTRRGKFQFVKKG